MAEFSLRKSPGDIEQEDRWTPEPVWTFEIREKSLGPTRILTQDHPFHG